MKIQQKKSLRSHLKLVFGLSALLSLGYACRGPNPTGYTPIPSNPLLQAQAARSPVQAFYVAAYRPTVEENTQITLNDPNGPAPQLIRLIDSARTSLDGAFYDIRHMDIVHALVRAQKRGVRVRLVTEKDNLHEFQPCPTPSSPIREAIRTLEIAGIPIVPDNRSGLMHHKFLVVDRTQVWTGSTNLTRSSLFQHNNDAILLRSTQLATNFTVEFERLFTEQSFGPPRQTTYPSVKIGNSTINTYFSPRGGGQQAILAELSAARKSVAFMAFSFTDKPMGDILLQKHQQGLKVEGLFDACLTASQYSLYHPLQRAGVFVQRDGNQALLHNKVMIIDDQTLITGSYNFSQSAEMTNNENFLIIKNAPETVRSYRAEFERLKQGALTNNPPPGHCPGMAPPTPAPPTPPCQPPDQDEFPDAQ